MYIKNQEDCKLNEERKSIHGNVEKINDLIQKLKAVTNINPNLPTTKEKTVNSSKEKDSKNQIEILLIYENQRYQKRQDKYRPVFLMNTETRNTSKENLIIYENNYTS